jgi:predicted RNA-binding Zn-ribbon protein involved in translation (DUF1610 family)
VSAHNTTDQLVPVCPHCGHEMTDDEMSANRYKPGDDGDDLWALPVKEITTKVVCPDCDEPYFVKGGYTPRYTSAATEDELE